MCLVILVQVHQLYVCMWEAIIVISYCELLLFSGYYALSYLWLTKGVSVCALGCGSV